MSAVENVTWEAIKATMLVVLAVCGAIGVIGKAVDVIKGWRKPGDDTARTVRQNRDRIAALETANEDNRAGIRALCAGVRALLEHELHNGNPDELKTASDKIEKWVNGHI